MEQAEDLDYQIYKDYEVLGKIGKGTYGIVFKVKNKKSGKLYAIKKIIDAFQNLIDAKRTYRQLNYLFQLNHPNIVKLQSILSQSKKGLGVLPSTTRLESQTSDSRGCESDKISRDNFNNLKHVYALFEYLQADLGSVLKRCPQIQLIQRKFIAYQILHGLAYIHRSGLIHRDIKPENILVNLNNLQIKICDFGMARLRKSVTGNEGVFTQYVASRWYRPPQALLGINTCDFAIDLWGVGCVIAQLALRSPLFVGKSTLDQLQTILKSLGMPCKQDIQDLSSFQAKYVMQNFTFNKRSKQRPIRDILNMCDSQQVDLILKLLQFNPKKRINAELALKHEYFNDIRHLCSKLFEYQNQFAQINDNSQQKLIPQSQSRGLTNTKNIDYYKKLIEQFQKYTDKSTNRSYPVNEDKKYKQIIFKYQQEDNMSEGFNQKSTKQSNYIFQHKNKLIQQAKITANCSIFKQIAKNQNEKGILNRIQQSKSNYLIKTNKSINQQKNMNKKTNTKIISQNKSNKSKFIKQIYNNQNQSKLIKDKNTSSMVQLTKQSKNKSKSINKSRSKEKINKDQQNNSKLSFQSAKNKKQKKIQLQKNTTQTIKQLVKNKKNLTKSAAIKNNFSKYFCKENNIKKKN